ncbi:phosphate regulon sensor histidine kinase PhoR [Nocardioides aestuarii]|uniref:Sensor-like histidine kinase SenX3 n=1 Tax=Nocardioides aestuarii TaxID=252231 RepID=A0ABW4TIH1_9ACTN
MTIAEPLTRPRTPTPAPAAAPRSPHASYAGLGVGVTAFTVAALVGRLTVLDGGSFAMVWPAAGVALVWFVLRGARPLGVDTAALFGAAFAVNFFTGAPALLAVALGGVNVLQTVVHLTLLRRFAHELGVPRPRLESLQSLATLVWTGAAAAVVAVAAGGLAVGSITHVATTPVELVVWAGRLLAGTVVVGSLGLLAAQCRQARWERVTRAVDRHPVEAVALGATTVATMALVFTVELPLAFTLVVPVVWSAKRYPTVVSALVSVVSGGVAVTFTLLGQGPFSLIDDPRLAALTVQGYVVMLSLLGLFVAIARDEREELIQRLAAAHSESRHQAQLLTSIVDSMDEGVTAVDGRGSVLIQNPAAMRMLEIDAVHSPDQLAHRGVTSDGQQIDRDRRPSVRALRGEHVHEDVLMQRRDGSTRHVRVSATPLAALSVDDVARAVMVFRDVTDEVEQEAALKAFAATVAHDLHNPLAAMIGWNEVMLEMLRSGDADPATLLRLGERLGGSADRLQELVDGLLEDAASKGRELDLARVDLGEVLRGVTHGRGAEDRVTWGPLPVVRADRLLTGQLLDNLVGNALKYVAPGTVPRVEVSADVRAPGWVTVEVADNGIGIPEGEHEHVFERFARAHGSDPAYQGTGLGLAIVKRIVTRHDGTISARPGAGGVGTVVEFTLPAA